jgi:hypothetical protein
MKPNPKARPIRSWDAIDEQMEREANAVKGSMHSAGQLRTKNLVADTKETTAPGRKQPRK